jgi:hypothetical protein
MTRQDALAGLEILQTFRRASTDTGADQMVVDTLTIAIEALKLLEAIRADASAYQWHAAIDALEQRR